MSFPVHGIAGSILALVALSSCDSNGPGGVDPDGLQAVGTASGVHTGVVQTREGDTVDFTVYLPPRLSSSNHPLVIALHRAGSRSTMLSLSFIQFLVEPALAKLNPVILAPDLPRTAAAWTSPDAEDLVLDILETAKKVWPVDPKRIVLTGYSDGGIGTWFLAGKHADRFSGRSPWPPNRWWAVFQAYSNDRSTSFTEPTTKFLTPYRCGCR